MSGRVGCGEFKGLPSDSATHIAVSRKDLDKAISIIVDFQSEFGPERMWPEDVKELLKRLGREGCK